MKNYLNKIKEVIREHPIIKKFGNVGFLMIIAFFVVSEIVSFEIQKNWGDLVHSPKQKTESQGESDLNENNTLDNRVWDGTVEVGWDAVKGDGSAKAPYQIEKASQLAWLAFSSQTNTYKNTHFILKNDIILNNFNIQGIENDIEAFVENGERAIVSPNIHQWTPIGNEDYPFAGCFNGCQYTISGLYISSEENYQGLFGVCSENSIIENVNIKAATIHVNGIGVGSVAGKSDGLINRCNIYSAFIVGGGYVGGIAGIAHEIVNTYAYTWVMGYNDSYEAMNGKFKLSQELRKCYGGLAGYCDYVINSMSSAYMQHTYKVNGGLVGELSSDAYNCLALGIYINDCGYINKDDVAWLSGDVIGQYDGNDNLQVTDKKLYYISKNCMKSYIEKGQIDLAKKKYPNLQFHSAKSAPVGITMWTYENHDYSVKTNQYNELSSKLSDISSAVNLLNGNISNIVTGTSIENILMEHGISGCYMELTKWVMGNGKGCFADIKRAPWIKTANQFKKSIGIN